MRGAVVDTNVGIVANGGHDRASIACQFECVRALREITGERGRKLALDSLQLIFAEYRRHLSLSGEPGPGDEFIRWVSQRMFDPDRCELVPITLLDGAGQRIAEFPDDPRLSEFDPSDRKFAAVAARSECHAAVLNAVDSGWVYHRGALAEHGVEVEFLCPDILAAPDV